MSKILLAVTSASTVDWVTGLPFDELIKLLIQLGIGVATIISILRKPKGLRAEDVAAQVKAALINNTIKHG